MEAVCSTPCVGQLHFALSRPLTKSPTSGPSALILRNPCQLAARQQFWGTSPKAGLSSAHSSFSSPLPVPFQPVAQARKTRSAKQHALLAVRASAEDGQQFDYDLFTIGAGSGGVRASRFASQYGAKVAVCELPFSTKASDDKGGVGGTCVLRGCVPKKLLVYGSHFADYFEDARGFGWSFPGGEPEVDWSHLIEKKNKELDRLNNAYKTTLKNAKVDLIEGKGTIVDRHTVDVDGKRFKVKNILIATGGRIFVPPIPGAEHVITSDDALDLTSVPSKIAIVGGGYIALEFAGIFNSAGAEVDIFVRGDKLLRGFDDEVREFLAEQLQAQGIRIHFGAKPVEISKQGEDQLTLKTEQGDTWQGSHVMFATGRRPNIKGLGLEEAGVEFDDKKAIKVDEYSRTSVDNIWAVGDVTDRINLTPVALMEGMAFAKTAFKDEPTKPDHTNVPSAVFTNPPIGTVGLTEAQAVEQYGDVDVFTSTFRPMKSTISGNPVRTFVKILVDAATDKVVGLHMCGEDGPEIMQGFAVAVRMGVTKKQMDSTVGIHPTSAEELVTMRTPTRQIRKKEAQNWKGEKEMAAAAT